MSETFEMQEGFNTWELFPLWRWSGPRIKDLRVASRNQEWSLADSQQETRTSVQELKFSTTWKSLETNSSPGTPDKTLPQPAEGRKTHSKSSSNPEAWIFMLQKYTNWFLIGKNVVTAMFWLIKMCSSLVKKKKKKPWPCETLGKEPCQTCLNFWPKQVWDNKWVVLSF